MSRNAMHLWDPDLALHVWDLNFNFFRRVGFSPDLSVTMTNRTAPLLIDSQLKAGNPTPWETMDRELKTSTFSISIPLLEFGPNFSPVAPSWSKLFRSRDRSIQRKNIAGQSQESEKFESIEGDDMETKQANFSENYVQRLPSSGQPLPQEVRDFYEPRFHYDFGSVRVHTDAIAAKTAQGVNALAYTLRDHIVFNSGQFSPTTDKGKRLLAHELTHVIQQGQAGSNIPSRSSSFSEDMEGSGGQKDPSSASNLTKPRVTLSPASFPSQRVFRQRSPFEVRSPSLEVSALRGQAAFGSRGYPLTNNEISDAQAIFGSSINLSQVRIVYTPIISAPTTLGNTIRVTPGYSIPRDVLIHELTHIWQFQTKGSGYISDSIFHQLGAVLTHRGDRGPAYDYKIVAGKSFHDYTAEQQASIVQDYFVNPNLRANAEYQRLIGQVRAASPMAMPPAFFEEQAAGLPPREFELPPPPGLEQPREGRGIPQIEFRF